jgi:ABC-type cobalamin/Fe3+-siderophores transport system ATPase subunit
MLGGFCGGMVRVGTPWKIFGYTVVSMGDSPAANFMELTKKRGAMMFKHIDEVAAVKIKKDTFVDDLSTGGSKQECVMIASPTSTLSIKNLSNFLAVSGALNSTFLAFSGALNMVGPFWSFQGP